MPHAYYYVKLNGDEQDLQINSEEAFSSEDRHSLFTSDLHRLYNSLCRVGDVTYASQILICCIIESSSSIHINNTLYALNKIKCMATSTVVFAK